MIDDNVEISSEDYQTFFTRKGLDVSLYQFSVISLPEANEEIFRSYLSSSMIFVTDFRPFSDSGFVEGTAWTPKDLYLYYDSIREEKIPTYH
ncbi:hypothetical protein ACFLZX_00875 [Nanoarchaeota archaeon]